MKPYVNPTTHVITSAFGRLSYPCLFKPKRIGDAADSPEFYQASLLVPKDEEGNRFVAELKAEAARVAQDKFGKGAKNVKLSFLKDGDTLDGDENVGMWIISTKSKDAIPVIDRNRQPVLKENGGEQTMYAGCQARLVLDLWAWTHKTGGKGVSANLTAVQKIGEGAPLGRKPIDLDNVLDDDLPPEEQSADMDDAMFD